MALKLTLEIDLHTSGFTLRHAAQNETEKFAICKNPKCFKTENF